jgi:23S rRNA pseudouridine1911/1915/1917 synthase
VAIACRAPSPDNGVWDAPIGRARDPRKRAAGGRDAAEARTTFSTVARAGGAALLALAPETGRTHQLRVHASHAGAPLLGDRDYGGPGRVTLPDGRVLPLRRIALHAARVTVPRPSGPALVIDSPIPVELRELWTSLGGEDDVWRRAVG